MSTPTGSARPSEGSHGPRATSPFISVIVTDHDRREYVGEAVESLLHQTLPRERFEVLVVKNFRDRAIDGLLDENGVSHWLTTARPLTEKIVEALARARGRVIAFLEDDDRYVPERLGAVEAAFLEDPTLGFFRNAFDVIDARGRPWTGPLPEVMGLRQRSAIDLVVPEREKDRYYRTLVEARPDFNTSTIAIRRDILEPRISLFPRMVVGVDRFLFYAALAAPCTLRLDRRPLTEYRLHGENNWVVGGGIGTDTPEKLDRIMAADLSDGEVIYELVRPSPRRVARHELEGRRLMNEMYDVLRRAPNDRRRMMQLLRHLPEYRDTESVRVNRRLALEGAAYVVSPSAARRFHRRHIETWLRLA